MGAHRTQRPGVASASIGQHHAPLAPSPPRLPVRSMRFSVLTAVCDPPPDVLAACLDSVRSQMTDDVEHVIVDDASTSADVRDLLDAAARCEPRITLVRHDTRSGIVAASNSALDAATGEFVALLDHDDVLADDALAVMNRAITASTDLAYSDHDLIRPDGRFADPVHKPDFSPERLRQQNYITHFVVARRALVVEVGGFGVGFDGAQDHDLLLRLSERARDIVHVPEVLYHWRMTAASVALDPNAKQYAYERGRLAVAEHCERIGIAAEVELGRHLGTYRVKRAATRASTSVLIAASGGSATVWGRHRPHLAALLDSLADDRSMIDEIIVAVPAGDGSDGSDGTLDDRISRVVTHAPDASPFAVAARAATGDVAIVLDEAMMLDAGSSLAELLALLAGPDVAAVGSAQFHPDGCVRHGGLVVQGGTVASVLFGWHRDHSGPGRLMDVNREVSAVDLVGSAWRMRELRELLDTATLDTATLDTATLGVRTCLEAAADGRRVLWTPFTAFTRCDRERDNEGVAHPSGNATAIETPDHDRYYNPSLVPGRADWLELPGRAGAPPCTVDGDGRRHWS